MKLNRVLLTNLLLIIGIFALSIWAWIQLPPDAQIPTRFDFNGAPVGYMGKVGGLLFLPAMTLAFAVTELILPKTEPNQNNMRRSLKAHNVFSVALIAFFGIIHLTIVLSALDRSINTTDVVTTALGIFMVVTGNYLSKIRRNNSFGFRTSWTLSSELAWHKTHRLASWLTVIHGFTLIVAGLISNTTLLIITLTSFVAVNIIILPVYSYHLWKSDSKHLNE